MGRTKKKSASEVAVTPPASSPEKPKKKGKREAEVVIENELVSAKKRKAPKNGKPDSESHSDKIGVEEVAVAALPPPPPLPALPPPPPLPALPPPPPFPALPPPPPLPSFGRSEEEQSTNSGFSSKTIAFQKIPRHSQKADILEFFKSAGEVVGVRLFTRREEDTLTGRGVVVFASAEEAQKALRELHGKYFMERKLRLSLPKDDVMDEKIKKLDGSKTLIFKHLSEEAQEEDILEFFKSAGEVVSVRRAMNKDGSFNGQGHVVFATAKEAQRALVELHDRNILERPVAVLPGRDEKKVECGGKTTIFIKNLSYQVREEDVLEFFKPAGEVVDVRLAKRGEYFRGDAHVDFATAEQAEKALLELNGKQLLQRTVKLAWEEGEEGGKTLLASNLAFQAQKADIVEFFKPAGEVEDVRLVMRGGGSNKGYAHVDFATAEQAEKALKELNGKKMLQRKVNLAWEGGEVGGKTLVAFNLFFQAQKADVLKFFKPAEGVVDVRLAMKEADSFKGYGHVDFATAEQAEKAVQELDGKLLMGRPVRLFVARDPKNGEYRPPVERRPELEVFVTGHDLNGGEDNVRASLMDHFASCGEIERISLPRGQYGKSAGIAYVRFLNETARNKALELGTETIVVEVPRPRADSNRGGGGRRPSMDV